MKTRILPREAFESLASLTWWRWVCKVSLLFAASSIVALCKGLALLFRRVVPSFPHEVSDERQKGHVRFGGRVVLASGVLGQLGLAALGVWAWLWIGGTAWILYSGMAAFLICCATIDLKVWREVKSASLGCDGGCLAWLFWLGFPLGCAGGLFLVSKMTELSKVTANITIGAFLAIAVLEIVRIEVRDKLGEQGITIWAEGKLRAMWLSVWCGMALGPFFIGWLVASFLMPLASDKTSTVRAWLDANPPPRPRTPGWTVEDEPIPVAVTLSGGGYRAALTHAGVLAALDEQQIPIDILSTVSGGSIIGASYALGVPPQEFALRLEQQKPGLADALLSIRSAYGNRSRTYATHVRDAYFGNRTLEELPHSPRLLLNVTNMYAVPREARENIFRGWASQTLESRTQIADAVTASGAFPGAFGPIELDWHKRDQRGAVEGVHYLLDGGVVENLGTEGLRIYLTQMAWTEWYRKHPRILIISDASGYAGSGERMVVNPPADQMLFRATDIQFDTLHRLVYSEVTGTDDLPARISNRLPENQYYTIDYPYRFLPPDAPKAGSRRQIVTPNLRLKEIVVPQPKLRTIVIPITMTATSRLLDRFPERVGSNGEKMSAIQARISSLPTLNELDRQQARDAFEVGYALGRIYGPAIQKARSEVRGSLQSQ